MAVNDQRWHQLGDPVTPDEAAALAALRELLPDSPLTHAWANVTFRDDGGRASEVDVILLHSNGLFLLELKGWHGTIVGDQQHWQVTAPNGRTRSERDPFLVTDGKAKRFSSMLKEAAAALPGAGRKLPIPFVTAVTLMHGQGSSLRLDAPAAATTYGLDGYQVSGVRSIRELLTAAPEQYQNVIDAQRAKALVALIKSLGLVARPRVRMVGQYEVERADPLGEGPGWVDVRARHPVMAKEHRRIRLYDVPPKATPAQRKEIERAAHREYVLTTRLEHPGITRALEILAPETGPAIVFPDDAGAPPLAEHLAAADLDFDSRIALIRQLGEVLEYAHRHHVAHRSLTPSAVHVREVDGRPRVMVRDWQAGQREPSEGTTRSTLFAGTAEVAGLVAADSWLYLAPEAHMPNPAGEALDVYGLGALAYLILTDAPPAPDMNALQQRLAAGGLDPAVDRDGLPAELCDVVRRATVADLGERTTSVAAFLAALTEACRPADGQEVEPTPVPDPRLADSGDVIADRWIVGERLGSGSSGVALLVDDEPLAREGLVLKVAVDERAGERLAAEAEVLATLDHPRIVALVEGPLAVDGHAALLLEDAGRPTLGRRLADEGRLTLEQLEGYGADLFEAVGHLESVKVFHRDIKPDNLGVREARGDRRRHLVLFDFSLAREPLEKVGSGTQGYLDPFLRREGRSRYNSAAERFAVASTLFEMATGARPEFGDGVSDPALTGAEVHIAPGAFEPEVAPAMTAFFRRALAPRVADRFDDLTSMAQSWARVFPSAHLSVAPELPLEQRDALAAAATLTTPLERAGLSAQAVSAARRIGAHTVAELLDASGFAINNEPGLGVVVRAELQRRRKEWAARLRTSSTIEEGLVQQLRGVETTQRSLVPRARSRAAAATALARRMLNIDLTSGALPWPDLATAARESGQAGDPAAAADLLARHWADSTWAKEVLADVGEALAAAGGLATADELAERLVAVRGSSAEGPTRRCNALGLVRAAVEGDAGATLAIRRHGEQVLVTGADGPAPERCLDEAVALSRAVDEALAGVGSPLGPNAGLDLVRRHPGVDRLGLADPARALALAARVSRTGALSARGELYPTGMPAAPAVAAVLAGASRRISPARLRALVSSRFPQAQPAPDRPTLDALVSAAAPGLAWDPDERAYIRATSGSSLLPTGTLLMPTPVTVRYDAAAEALAGALARRAAAVVTCSPAVIGRVPGELADRHGVRVVDVTATLIEAMHQRAEGAGVDWSIVLRADAADPGSGDRANLERLVADAVAAFWPQLLSDPDPLLLVDCAPLARYGQLGRLAELLDTATTRPAARWVLVPKRAGAAAPTIDGVPLPLAAGTWIELSEAAGGSAAAGPVGGSAAAGPAGSSAAAGPAGGSSAAVPAG